MDITPAQLTRIYGIPFLNAANWAGPINAAMREFGISTSPDRIAAFLAQIGHESGRLRYVREIWGPTPVQERYEGRADLGNTQPGDGKRFMGRGLIQITGRANYAQISDALGEDFVRFPGLLERPEFAARSAGWFWASRGLNELADAGDHRRITRRINGGLNGLEDRLLILAAAQRELQAAPA